MGEKESKCVSVGMKLLRENLSFREATPIMFQENLGLTKEALTIPSSEAALHQNAAGKEVVAVFATRGLAFIGYVNGEGRCDFAYGTRNEMLGRALNDRLEEMLGVRRVVQEYLDR
ncbi:hypothetical protein ES705_25781 [subsurface metagenome]